MQVSLTGANRFFCECEGVSQKKHMSISSRGRKMILKSLEKNLSHLKRKRVSVEISLRAFCAVSVQKEESSSKSTR